MKERFTNMPEDNLENPVAAAGLEYYQDPVAAATILSRRNCVPDLEIYQNNPNLKNNPAAAGQHVELTGDAPSLQDLSLENRIVVGAAKIKAAGNNLTLSDEQKGYFAGIVDNALGSIPFLGRVVGRVAGISIAAEMALTACSPVNASTPTEIFSASQTPIVETTDVPGFIPATETSTVSATEAPTSPSTTETAVSPTETATPAEIMGNPYPSSEQNFDINNILTGSAAEQKLTDLGVGDDLSAMKAWYKANGITDSMMEVNLYQGADGTHWDVFVKSSDGHYNQITITSGKEKGQVVRAFGLASYLMNKPSFTISELQNPSDHPNATQKVIWDKSGWSVIGAFDGGSLVSWQNADATGGGTWVSVEGAAATEAAVEPGTTYLDPEYNLGGKVEINAENSKAFYSYFADAFWRINKDYFKNLGVTDSAGAEKYMEENVLPEGFSYPIRIRDYAYTFTKSTVPIDFRSLDVRLISYDKYTQMTINQTGLTSVYSNPDAPNNVEKVNSALIGFELIPNNTDGSSKMVLEVVQAKEEWGATFGFPDSDGTFNSDKLDKLDNYLRGVAYTIRTCDYSEPTIFLLNDSLNMNIVSSTDFMRANKTQKIFTFAIITGVIDSLSAGNLPTDLPPQILSLGGN